MTTNEWRVFGPPGCGKTTWLGNEVTRAIEARGVEAVLVTSLTRAAAAEVVSRGLPIPREKIGTLHAHAYRSLQFPELAETKKHIAGWNDEHGEYAITGQDIAIEEAGPDDGVARSLAAGDRLLSAYNLYRARLVPEPAMPMEVRAFARDWEGWKKETALMDFADLIYHATHDVFYAPGQPSVIFVDEAQDMDAAEFALLRRWSLPDRDVDRLILVGDPDQNLYQWRGSDPEAFLTPTIPEERIRVLEQSYRVPWLVHGVAVEWINRVRSRADVSYLPRDAEGEVRHLPRASDNPQALITDAGPYLEQGKTVMFLTACGYMLEPLVRELRRQAIPFHNPYRVRRGDWNPMRRAGGDGLGGWQRLLAYMRPLPEVWGEQARDWTLADFMQWSDALAHVLKRGMKKTLTEELETLGGYSTIEPDELDRLFQAGVDPLSAYDVMDTPPDFGWFEEHLKAAARPGMRFPLAVARKHGGAILRKPPQIIVGTIHSVKGGEADVVYLFPDLSRPGHDAWLNPTGRDAVYRQMYVGMTRARESLILCAPTGHLAVRW